MSQFILCLHNKTVSDIWYLTPFMLFKRSLNKSLMLDLLASNRVKGCFGSIISTL